MVTLTKEYFEANFGENGAIRLNEQWYMNANKDENL